MQTARWRQRHFSCRQSNASGMMSPHLKTILVFYFLFLLFFITENALIKSLTTTSRLSCCVACVKTENCRGMTYDDQSNVCDVRDSVEDNPDWVKVPDTETTTESATWYHFINIPAILPACDVHLVSGAEGVTDDQLTASSFRNGNSFHGPDRARLFTDDVRHPNGSHERGAWTPDQNNDQQFIQVHFNSESIVKGILTQGRRVSAYDNCCAHHVTKYRVLYSFKCTDFDSVQDSDGNDMIFPGNDDQASESVVTNLLESPVIARCLRVNPVEWRGWPSLRLDVIGCAL